MKRFYGFLAVIAFLATAAVAHAQNTTTLTTFSVQTSVFDPDNSEELVSTWLQGLGVAKDLMDASSLPTDGNDLENQGLVMSADGLSSAGKNGAGLAQIVGAQGQSLTELGYDLRDGSNCGGGNPRFWITTVNNCQYFIECDQDSPTVTPLYGSWNRRRWTSLTGISPTGATPSCASLSSSDTVKTLYIIFDAGTDGFAILDNIDVNTTLIGHGPRPAH
jgi:hypothetical protein